MDDNHWNKVTIGVLIGLMLLLFLVGSFHFIGDLPDTLVYKYLLAGIAIAIAVIAVVYVILVAKGKIPRTEPDYRMLFTMGIIFLPIGLASGSPAFLIFSLAFLVIGLFNKSKWKKELAWSELLPAQKKFKIMFMVVLGIVVLASFAVWFLMSRW